MPKLQAVLFDLDDTLYPERSFVVSGFRAVAAWAAVKFNIPVSQGLAELTMLFDDGVRGNIFDIWLQNHGFKPHEWVPKMVTIYREHRPEIKPYPEVPQLLTVLKTKYKLGILTDGPPKVQKRKLEALDLSHYFSVCVISDEWGEKARKPSPIPYKIAVERLGISGSEAIYVADNPLKDFFGARQAGLKTVRVRRSDGLYRHFEAQAAEFAPDFEIPTLENLVEIITAVNSKI
ncbi:MAG: HAD family hydrolase [Deltaproteobacteria bacterium]|nr:HAD family hydrolase [Deltaproteobacteria bacterium]